MNNTSYLVGKHGITPYRGYRRNPRVERYHSHVEEIQVVRRFFEDTLCYVAFLLVVLALLVVGPSVL